MTALPERERERKRERAFGVKIAQQALHSQPSSKWPREQCGSSAKSRRRLYSSRKSRYVQFVRDRWLLPGAYRTTRERWTNCSSNALAANLQRVLAGNGLLKNSKCSSSRLAYQNNPAPFVQRLKMPRANARLVERRP